MWEAREEKVSVKVPQKPSQPEPMTRTALPNAGGQTDQPYAR